MIGKSLFAAVSAFALAASAAAQSRDFVRVASSAPTIEHVNMVGEQFAKANGGKYKLPVNTRMTTTQAIQQLCAGVGPTHPDVAAATRRIAKSEVEACIKNGVGSVTEIKYGFFGVVIAQSKSGPVFDLTARDIYLAMAKRVPEGNKDGGPLVPNPNTTWKQVNPNFPGTKIEIWGPPAGTGTRDGLVKEGLEAGCKTFAETAKLDASAHAASCRTIRDDGVWNDSHDYEKTIIPRLIAEPSVIGVIGYVHYDENSDKLAGKKINGIDPTFHTIATGDYPLGFPYYIYVKKAHIGRVAGLKEYVAEFAHSRTIGRRGYLVRIGLIPAQEVNVMVAITAGRDLPDLKM